MDSARIDLTRRRGHLEVEFVGWITWSRGLVKELLSRMHKSTGNLLERRWNDAPFGREPCTSPQDYIELFDRARARRYRELELVERETGFAIDQEWLERLAFHTQITKKTSALVFEHGKLLYALLRRYIADNRPRTLTVLETGTARGFSALCMARALLDANACGVIVTLDLLPHNRKIYWNCIDDLDGRKTRAELLAPWSEELGRVVFFQGDTSDTLAHLGIERVNFAFLDAQHTMSAVKEEFDYVAARQVAGDIVVFDDVTPSMFPGICEAVDSIERQGQYAVNRLAVSERRGYAWGFKR